MSPAASNAVMFVLLWPWHPETLICRELLEQNAAEHGVPQNAVDALLGEKPIKDLAISQRSMLERTKSLKDLVVLNDETHHVHDEDLAWSQSLLAIHRALPQGLGLWLDFSATPKDQKGMYFPWTVCDYPLAQAVEDRIVKAPLIVSKEDDPKQPKHGAAVFTDGVIIAAGVAGTRRAGRDIPVGIEDRFHLGSDTKAFTSLLAGQFVQEGKLRWDSTLVEVFPELKEKMDADFAKITLEQLLSHSSGLGGLTSLQTLDLSGCWQLTDISPLARLTSLQTLNLSRCGQLSDLSPLAGLTSLQTLYFCGCGQLSDLSPLSPLTGLTSLQMLYLFRCEQLRELALPAPLTSLQTLGLSDCGQLRELTLPTGLRSLQTLDLSACGQLRELTLPTDI